MEVLSHPADTPALAAKGGCTLSEQGIIGNAVGPVVTVYMTAYMMVNTLGGGDSHEGSENECVMLPVHT